MFNNLIYYLFKIFPRFWLVKTTHIIHYNRLLLTKFRKNFVTVDPWCQECSLLQIIDLMMSKWRQKCSSLQIIEPLTEKTWGQGSVIFGDRKNKERNGEEIFWMNNKAIIERGWVGYEEFCRSRRVLSTEAEGWGGTPSEICRILHILRKPNSIVLFYDSFKIFPPP